MMTFGVSWSLWFIVHRAGYSLSDPVVQLLTAAFVPAAAAIVVRRFVTREGFADSGLWPRFRSAWRQYVVATTLPLVILAFVAVAAAVTGRLATTALPLAGATTLTILASAPFLVVVAAPLYWGEEFGWTSYLRMRLFPGRPWASTLTTGIVWGVWHWPLTFTGYFDGTDLGGTGDVAVQLLLWVVLSVLLEYVLTWSFWSSGTIWTTSIVHAGNNLVVAAGTSAMLPDAGLNAGTFLMCLALVPVCLVIWVRGRGSRAAGRGAR